MKTRNHSKKREAILTKIRSTTSHPTAEWVYQELKNEHPDLSLATVYRNINLFKEDGAIVSVGTVAGQERIDGNTLPHTHFVCLSCRAVIDVALPAPEAESVAKLQRAGFQVERVDLTVHGTCETCVKSG